MIVGFIYNLPNAITPETLMKLEQYLDELVVPPQSFKVICDELTLTLSKEYILNNKHQLFSFSIITLKLIHQVSPIITVFASFQVEP